MYFTEEHNLFRESLKDFLQKEVVPHIEKWEDSGKILDRFWRGSGAEKFVDVSGPVL